MSLGKFKASHIPNITAVVAGVAILLCEIIAVHYGHEKPFPRATISMTAGHYPEYVIFRIAIQCSSTLLIMTWFLHYFWLRTKVAHAGRYLPEIFLFLGTIGAIGLMAASATIDTGVYKNHIHVICAVVFFLGTIWACIFDTLICLVIWRTKQTISQLNVTLKVIVSMSLFVWMILAIFYKSPYRYFTEVAEYSMTYLILAYALLIGRDLKGFVLDYELKSWALME